MRDVDILSDIKTREEEITRLQDEISALKKVAEIYGLNGHSSEPIKMITPTPTPPTTAPTIPTLTLPPTTERKGFGESKFPMSIIDAAVQVLQNEPDGLHLDVILERIGQLGVAPTRTSLDSALRDGRGKGKLVLLGKRIWTLPIYVK